MNLTDLNEALIRRGAGSPEVFRRGEDYRRRGAVANATFRGGTTLTAHVVGSDFDPYLVTIHLGRTRIDSANCTCPYGEEWEGWCKHIVATLLLGVYSPERVNKAEPLDALLDELEPAALKTILIRLSERDPRLADVIAAEAAAASETAPATDSQQSERRLYPAVDTDEICRQVKASIRSLDRMRSSEAYWHVGGVVNEIMDGPVHSARVRLSKGDFRGSLATLEAVMDAYVADWTDLDGSDGETPEPFFAAGRIAAEALLSANDLTPSERKSWARKLTRWQNEIEDYGVDKAFAAAITAAERGWDDPALQAVLRGETVFLDWDIADWAHSGGITESASLLDILINVLERREQHEEALRLALATGQLGRATTLLVRLERVEETLRLAEARAVSPETALEMARALEEADEMHTALTVAEMTIDRPAAGDKHGRYGLSVWLRDAAEAANRPDLAQQAAIIAVREVPNLENWLRAEQLTELSQWPSLRKELLDNLHRINSESSYGHSNLTPIFLHENRIDDALHSVRGYANPALLARVADAAIDERPDAVQTISRREAEAIMNEGKSGFYDTARDWLRRYKTALSNAGRAEEWPPYRDALLEKHRRRYRLIPLIKELG